LLLHPAASSAAATTTAVPSTFRRRRHRCDCGTSAESDLGIGYLLGYVHPGSRRGSPCVTKPVRDDDVG
jgi:hypothetical protein